MKSKVVIRARMAGERKWGFLASEECDVNRFLRKAHRFNERRAREFVAQMRSDPDNAEWQFHVLKLRKRVLEKYAKQNAATRK